jgi:hypothetical protein
MGVAAHGVSGEPGGDALLDQNMAFRETVALGFPVHSDPAFTLLPPPHAAMFTFAPKPDDVTSYAEHTIVQPALVFLDRTGKILTAWSWKLDEAVPTRVDMEDWERIKTRPSQEDIIASLKERRMVKTQKYAGGEFIP